jgi:monoamine oxidase
MFHARTARSLLYSVARQNKNQDVGSIALMNRRMFMSNNHWTHHHHHTTLRADPTASTTTTQASSSLRSFMMAASGLAIAGGITVRNIDSFRIWD